MLTELQIQGMHCQACKKLIEAEIGELAGVNRIEVSLAANAATVEFDEQQLSLATLTAKINELGYQAQA
jgi:copper ion binding protein